jgi:glutaminase
MRRGISTDSSASLQFCIGLYNQAENFLERIGAIAESGGEA